MSAILAGITHHVIVVTTDARVAYEDGTLEEYRLKSFAVFGAEIRGVVAYCGHASLQVGGRTTLGLVLEAVHEVPGAKRNINSVKNAILAVLEGEWKRPALWNRGVTVVLYAWVPESQWPRPGVDATQRRYTFIELLISNNESLFGPRRLASPEFRVEHRLGVHMPNQYILNAWGALRAIAGPSEPEFAAIGRMLREGDVHGVRTAFHTYLADDVRPELQGPGNPQDNWGPFPTTIAMHEDSAADVCMALRVEDKLVHVVHPALRADGTLSGPGIGVPVGSPRDRAELMALLVRNGLGTLIRPAQEL